MGRNPLPTPIKRAKGTYRRNQSNLNEPKVPIEIPDPPKYLNGYALEFWKDVVDDLATAKILTKLDRYALAELCQAYKRWRKAEEQLEKKNFTETTTKGNIIQHPLVGIANKAMEQLHKLLSDFGMSPSSRSKIITLRTGGPKNNPWEGM